MTEHSHIHDTYERLPQLRRGHSRRGLLRLALVLAGATLPLVMGGAADTIVADESTCTLIDAITAANTDTATGGCPAGVPRKPSSAGRWKSGRHNRPSRRSCGNSSP